MVASVFVSYAHVDNSAYNCEGEVKGWVSQLVKNLSDDLSRRLGRTEYYTLWKDFRLKGSDEITKEIERNIVDSDALVVMMSKGWIESKWCQEELSLFCESHDDIDNRIFLVDQGGVSRESMPQVLQGLLGYPFYTNTEDGAAERIAYPIPQSTDMDYFRLILSLGRDLASVLQIDTNKKNSQIKSSGNMKGEEDGAVNVYVAPVYGGLKNIRNRFITELTQFGVSVWPTKNRVENDTEMNISLQKCSHFIQLLDAEPVMGIPRKYYDIAVKENKEVIQWRDKNLEYSAVDQEHKFLLDNETVIACSLTDFTRFVLDKVIPKPESNDSPFPPGIHECLVFIHTGQEDFEHAYRVAQELRNKGYGIALPRYQGDPGVIYKSIKRGCDACDVVLMVHKRTPAETVEDILFDTTAMLARRGVNKKELPILICQCNDAEELFFLPPQAHTLACSGDFDNNCLTQFLNEVDV